MSEQIIAKEKTVFYSIFRGFLVFAFHTFAPVRYHDAEKLTRTGAYVMIANHQSFADPALLAEPVKDRQVVFIGKKELAKNKLIEKILTSLHCILIDRHNRDMEAMRTASKILKQGRILGIFPEGTRHHEGQMEHIETGAALLTMRNRAPLIPVYINRKFRFFRFTDVYVGDEIRYDDLLEAGVNAQTCEQLNERIKETYREMIAAAEKK